jgi:hypothetical protein
MRYASRSAGWRNGWINFFLYDDTWFLVACLHWVAFFLQQCFSRHLIARWGGSGRLRAMCDIERERDTQRGKLISTKVSLGGFQGDV